MKNFYSPVMAISSTMIRRMAMPIIIRIAMLSMVPDMVVIIKIANYYLYRRDAIYKKNNNIYV